MKFKKFAVGLTVLTVMNTATPTIKVFANELENTNLKIEKTKKELKSANEHISNMQKFDLESHEKFEEYKKEFKIARDLIEDVSANAKHHASGTPEKAIDEDINTFWETGKKNSDEFKNEFTVEFKELVSIDKMTYKIRRSLTGFLNKYELYASKTTDGDDFELITKGSGETTLDTMEINFKETKVKRVKIVFKEALRDFASIADIAFYKKDIVMEEVNSIFEDRLCTTLSEKFDTIEELNVLEEKVNKHPLKSDFVDTIKLAKSMVNGENIQTSETITLSQRGDQNQEKQRTKQMYAGGNLDLTGYYIMPGETVEVYVDADENGKLPELALAQVGEVNPYPDATSNNANAKPTYKYPLKAGKNIVTAPAKGTTKAYAVYFSNRALPSEQKYAPKVRIAGENLQKYPIYIDGKTDPKEYIEQVKNHTGANMTDITGNRFLISTKNSEAKAAYIDMGSSPDYLAKEMERLISIFDLVSGLDENDENPLHRPSTGLFYFKMTDGPGMFAGNEYIHLGANGARNVLAGDVFTWGTIHEFAHQMENKQMRIAESTNNIYSLTAQLLSGSPYRRNTAASQAKLDEYFITRAGDGFWPEESEELKFGHGERLLVLLQVTNYFGVSAYSDAYRLLREDANRYNTGTEQSIVTAMSEATGYNLAPHFEMYKYPITEETKQFTSKFKKLDKKIQYTTEETYEMITQKVKTFEQDTKAIIKNLKVENDGVVLKLDTNKEYNGNIVYEIYRDGKLIGISRKDTYKDIVDTTKTYDYDVIAYDYRVNESIKSEKVNSKVGYGPVFELKEPIIQVEVNSDFNAKEYIKALTYNGNDISDNMVVTSNIDTSKRGHQTLKCEITDKGFTVKKDFDVEVVSSIDYVSDTDWKSATSGWKAVVKDKAVGSTNDIKLNIDDKVKEFDKGISASANAEIVYDIENKGYSHFTAYVGTDKNYDKTQTSLKFKVLADGKEVYTSELMKHDSNAEFIKIPLDGVKELKLIADENGDGITGDFASWANAKFIKTDLKPELEIGNSDISIPFKEEFDLMEGVKASDKEDGDLSSKVVIEDNGFNINKPGSYEVKYSVTDSDNNTITKIKNILVYSKQSYVSDSDWKSATSGWQKPVKDKAVGSSNKIKLNIDGQVKEFDKGLSSAANSEFVYDIEDKGYSYFTAYAGTDKNYNKIQTSLKFKVLADGKEVYSSELMKHNSDAEFIKIPLDRVKELKLVADDNGDGIMGDFASWADAKFITTNSKPELKLAKSISTKVGQPIEDLVGQIKAIDTEDGDLTSKVVVEAPKDINFNKPGEYTVKYSVTDSDNNTVTEKRYISVVDMRDEKFLTDYDWKSAVQSHSSTKKDVSAGEGVLRLTDENGKEVAYERGIGSHANATIIYDLSDKNYEYFTSFVGVDRSKYNTGASVTFEVYVDGEKRFDSGLMTGKTPQKSVEVDINGAKELKLIVTDGGNGIGFDHATWGDTKLHFVNTDRADITKLESAIEKAEAIVRDEYTDESLENLDKIVNEAKEVLQLDFISQEKCYEAIANIENAIRNLVLVDRDIKIRDKFLEEDIRTTLGIKDRELTIRDMEKLVSLTSDSGYVRSLDGLQYAKNLETLNVDYNEIIDISPIGKLEKLKNFSAKENYRDISDNVEYKNGKFILEEVVIDINGERLLPKEVIISPYNNPIKLDLDKVLVGNKVVIDGSLIDGLKAVDIVYESKNHDYQLYASTVLEAVDTDNSKDTYDANKIYLEGDTVTYKGEKYTAKWWVQGEAPDKSQAWEKEVKENEDGSVIWTDGMQCKQGDIVVYNDKKYEAKWWTTSTPGSDDSWILID